METSDYSLFVAVATGQGVSNLPPILQYAQKGDQILWLESREAEVGQWADASIALLRSDYGLKSHRRKVADLYAPKTISQPILQFVNKLAEPPARVYFVLNGGPKLTPLGLFGAGHVLAESRRSFLRFFLWPLGLFGVGNVLTKRAWEVYYLHGSDMPCMLRVYDSLTIKAAAPRQEHYQPGRMLSLSAIVRLKNALLKSAKLSWRYGEEYAYAFEPKKMETFYRLIEQKRGQQGHDDVGPMFEQIAFERIVRFFQERPSYRNVLKEVTGQVELWDEIRKIAELDVAITLLNGTVLSFECKTGVTESRKKVKDLNSRVFQLRRLTSQVGRMWVVMPYFPESSLFNEQKNRVNSLTNMGVQCLCFTPPEKYSDPTPPPFEKKLEEILKKY